MGILKKEEKVFQQDLNKVEKHPGVVFMIHLLMEEMCEMPGKELMHEHVVLAGFAISFS